MSYLVCRRYGNLSGDLVISWAEMVVGDTVRRNGPKTLKDDYDADRCAVADGRCPVVGGMQCNKLLGNRNQACAVSVRDGGTMTECLWACRCSREGGAECLEKKLRWYKNVRAVVPRSSRSVAVTGGGFPK